MTDRIPSSLHRLPKPPKVSSIKGWFQLIKRDELENRIAELRDVICEDYHRRAQNPLIVSPILHGGLIFGADLTAGLPADMDVEYRVIVAERYGSEQHGRGLRIHDTWIADLHIRGRNIILVDDILDEGITLRRIRDRLLAYGAASVKVCVLLWKWRTSEAPKSDLLRPEYVGFNVPNVFVAGYGLDDKGKLRHLRSIVYDPNSGPPI